MVLYGLKACDTCRKARQLLEAASKTVQFVDVRADGVPDGFWQRLLEAQGEAAVNRRSTTWKGLSDEDRARPAVELLAAHPALMKRPVIDQGGQLYMGWTAEVQAALL